MWTHFQHLKGTYVFSVGQYFAQKYIQVLTFLYIQWFNMTFIFYSGVFRYQTDFFSPSGFNQEQMYLCHNQVLYTTSNHPSKSYDTVCNLFLNCQILN